MLFPCVVPPLAAQRGRRGAGMRWGVCSQPSGHSSWKACGPVSCRLEVVHQVFFPEKLKKYLLV